MTWFWGSTLHSVEWRRVDPKASTCAVDANSWSRRVAYIGRILICPLLVPLLDILVIIESFGYYRLLEANVLRMEDYRKSRSLVETLFRSFPQVIFQTVVYCRGSLPETAVYIDALVYVPTAILPGTSLGIQLLEMYWAKRTSRMTIWKTIVVQAMPHVKGTAMYAHGGNDAEIVNLPGNADL